ncbi:MAG: hypothetical protein AB7E27_01120 [Candidatus Methanomethylophilaceae archaeon]|jgi:hypothetical protein
MDFDDYEVDLNARCVCGCMEGNRFHKIYRFPNMYGASVASNPKILGFPELGYRVLTLSFQSEREYCTEKLPIFDKGILDCDDWTQVEEVLRQIADL